MYAAVALISVKNKRAVQKGLHCSGIMQSGCKKGLWQQVVFFYRTFECGCAADLHAGLVKYKYIRTVHLKKRERLAAAPFGLAGK